MNHIFRYLVVLVLHLAVFLPSSAQTTLPDLTVLTDNGYNIISWKNPYKSGVKAIIVERSSDSTFNFTAIGIVKDFTHTIQSYVDITPLAGNNWYRVNVVFESDVEWMSNTAKITLDSMDIVNRQQVASLDVLQKKVNESLNKDGLDRDVLKNNTNQLAMPKSKYIYSNPFSGNVMIELPDTRDFNYFITFYTTKDEKVFEIPRIHEDEIILDKRNFQHLGTYKFIIMRDDKEFEKGFVTIY